MTWTRILPLADLEPGWVTPAQHGPRRFAVFDGRDGIRVTTALCSHAGADLCQGYFTGTAIECPLHQGLFDVTTGAAVGTPATRGIKTFESRTREGFVEVLL